MNIIKINPEKDVREQLAYNLNNSIFLAGPCPRKDYSNDWRNEAYGILEELGFNGNVITPTNSKYSTLIAKYGVENALDYQTRWEYEAMKKSSAVVFWVDRHVDKGFPAFTTNIEFGEWFDKEGTYFGFPDNAEKNEYLKIRLNLIGKKWYNNLKEMLSVVVKNLNRPSEAFFTSDTHFSQQRTLDLARRHPFINLYEMDLTIISNWNKSVTMNDIVFHAGDFGDISTMESTLSCLNFKTLYLVLGNYDREVISEIEGICSKLNRNIIISNQERFKDDESGKTFYVVHEPDEGRITPNYPNNVVLFGHIHGRQMFKKNGFDLATDYHDYTPISMKKVRWLADAIHHYDHNVFCDKAKV